jgi:hypothetical protein
MSVCVSEAYDPKLQLSEMHSIEQKQKTKTNISYYLMNLGI